MNKPRHLALVGPTASGKSSLAWAAARAVPGVEIVSVDSMQVYRGMDIGTAKPSQTEREQVRHHLLDLAEPHERFTVARFAASAAAVLRDLEDRGATALLVGGTGLYLQSILGDLRPPAEFPAIRRRLEAEAADDLPALYHRLEAVDPLAARRTLPTNRRRIVRALEVVEGSGRLFSASGPGVDAFPPCPAVAVIGVWLPRPVVASRIEGRVAEMMESGLLEEVRGLRARPGGVGPTARQALGYRELLAHVEDGLDLDAAVAAIVRRTRAFSVRQRRWFRRDPRVRWYGVEQNPLALVPAVLRELVRCRR